MKLITLYSGEEVAVDDEDYAELATYKWHRHHLGYAQRLVYKYISKGQYSKKSVLMHRHIMKPPKNMVIDHINRDKLDNRKINLRVVTQAENTFNKGIQSNNKSGYRCIHWDNTRKKWVVQVKILNKNKFVGRFGDFQEAIRARDSYELTHRSKIDI